MRKYYLVETEAKLKGLLQLAENAAALIAVPPQPTDQAMEPRSTDQAKERNPEAWQKKEGPQGAPRLEIDGTNPAQINRSQLPKRIRMQIEKV